MLLNDKLKLTLVCTASALALAACDGSGGGGAGASLQATLVTPVQLDQNTNTALRSLRSMQARMSTCDNVPEGYEPIADTLVTFIDGDGNPIPTADVFTDECGFFSTSPPAGTNSIYAASVGNRPLVAGLDAIVASGGVASTIASDAQYEIGFLSSFDDNTLGFSVTDSVTNKAVIGLSTHAFNVKLDDTSTALNSITTGLTSNDASIVVVSDASGSMSAQAFTDQVTGISYSRLNLASIAAHELLDQKSQDDEIAMLIFDGQSNFMDQQTIDDLFTFEDINGVPVNYTLSDSGFTTNSQQLRLIVDAYNADTQLWYDFNQFETHPDTPELNMRGAYPWGGTTAFYNSAILASEKLVDRNNPRKFIIAMSDGQDNGVSSIQNVIDTANTNKTPIYTIGFESASVGDLTRIANETGATYFQADNLELADAYNSIQTSIQFQYVGTLAQPSTGASQIVLEVDIDCDGVPDATRTISIGS